jgi:3-hydroxyacyl-CoA dehydrogenase/3a,7a,12a-trihydroxy-5b-cholest-24-enoyl-CoA hydratase
MSQPAAADLRALIGYEFTPFTFAYTPRDASLYALGIGCAANPLDAADLPFVYERHLTGFKVFPTFAVVFPSPMIAALLAGQVPGLSFDPMLLLHGEQELWLNGALPAAAVMTCAPVISAVYDKGKGALVVIDVPCTDADGVERARNRYSMFIRGLGGFGGERGASSDTPLPERPPDAIRSEQTQPNQALIYRLSGDDNPLHADPVMAGFAGFERPILHGLCTFGYAARAILRTFGGDDPGHFARMRARFTAPVFPGETLLTEMWDIGGGQIAARVRVAERDLVVLNQGVVDLR